jgi:hypothetical protein
LVWLPVLCLPPLLYLFTAQALLQLLNARGVGIPVAGQRLTALQYVCVCYIIVYLWSITEQSQTVMHVGEGEVRDEG